MRRVLIFVMTFIMFLGMVPSASADQVTDLQNNIKNIEGQIKNIKEQKNEQQEVADELLNEASSLKDDVEIKEKELQDLSVDLENIIKHINNLQESIKSAEDDLIRREQDAAARLCAMYENSHKTIFDLFLESSSITEFFQIVQIYKYIAEKDNEVICELDVARRELDIKRSMLNGDYDSILEQINKTKQDLYDLKLTRAELLRQVSLVQEQIRLLSTQEDKLEQESRDLAYKIKNLQTTKKYVGGDFTWPLPSDHTVHSQFGMRLHPIYKYYRMHTGIDIGGPYGAAIVAANSGTVLYAKYDSGYGYHVVIDHGGGFSTLYAHASKLIVKSGDTVKKGQTIAYVGSTGLSTGPHLHFEVRINGDPVNPLNYYKKQ